MRVAPRRGLDRLLRRRQRGIEHRRSPDLDVDGATLARVALGLQELVQIPVEIDGVDEGRVEAGEGLGDGGGGGLAGAGPVVVGDEAGV